MAIHVDATARPLIIVRFEGTSTDAEFDEYLAALKREVIDHEGVSATILDATRSGDTSAKQREKQALWLRKHALVLKKKSVGNAFVITSPIVRGVLTAVFWIEPPPVNHVIVKTLAEARAWAIARLAERGD